MPMRVDETGHQCSTAAVDEHGGATAIGRNRIRGNALDRVPAHEDVTRARKRTALAVEDPDVLKERDRAAGRRLLRLAGMANTEQECCRDDFGQSRLEHVTSLCVRSNGRDLRSRQFQADVRLRVCARHQTASQTHPESLVDTFCLADFMTLARSLTRKSPRANSRAPLRPKLRF